MPASSPQETGTRHRTAERVAKQIDALAISISAARDVVTIYCRRHPLHHGPDPGHPRQGRPGPADPGEVQDPPEPGVHLALARWSSRTPSPCYDVLSVLQRSEMVLVIVAGDRALHHRAGHRGPAGPAAAGGAAGGRARGSGGDAGRLPARSPTSSVDEARDALGTLHSEELLVARRVGRAPRLSRRRRRPRAAHASLAATACCARSRVCATASSPTWWPTSATWRHILNASAEELAPVTGVGAGRASDIKEGLLRLRELEPAGAVRQ